MILHLSFILSITTTITHSFTYQHYDLSNRAEYKERNHNNKVSFSFIHTSLKDVIISPFDEEGIATTATAESSSSYTRTDPVELQEEILDLTLENVELVLDEMRPFLIQVCFYM